MSTCLDHGFYPVDDCAACKREYAELEAAEKVECSEANMLIEGLYNWTARAEIAEKRVRRLEQFLTRMEELFPEELDAGSLPLTLAMARIAIVSAREAL